jgi:hypothetical protein
MSMRSKQTGVTFIGWIILLIPVAICGYAGIRLAPVYLNYMKVARTLEGIKGEFKAGGDTAAIHKSLERHLVEIESVDYPAVQDFKVRRDGQNWILSVAYDDQAPLFANVFILVTFDKSVTFGGGAND